MQKKIIILVVILLFILTSCDNANNKESFANEIELLKTENESLKEKIRKLEKEIADSEKAKTTLKDELEKVKSTLGQESTKPSDGEAKEIELEVLIEEYFLDGEVSFSIETNLPNNTEAIVTLENDKDYMAQDKITIYGGRAATAYFSDGNSPIPYGDYTVEFLLPYSQAQPEDVQKILGNDYKNLISDKKEKDKYGVSISVTKKVSIKKTTDN